MYDYQILVLHNVEFVSFYYNIKTENWKIMYLTVTQECHNKIMNAINQHFYFFGQTTDEIVTSFGYDGSTLILNGQLQSFLIAIW